MKTIYNKTIKNIILAAFTIALLTGCTDGFEDINTNPHEFTKVQPENLMATAVKRSMSLMVDLNRKMYWPYTHQVAMGSGDMARYGSSSSDVNGIWRDFYATMYFLKTIQNTYSNTPGYENRVLIAQIWECYMFFIGASTFGGMPYTDACRMDITSLKYDSEDFIYRDILRRLTDSFNGLDPTKDKFGQDLVFADGSIEKWKKFANTLRLKIALEVQHAVPEEAELHGKEAIKNESYLVSSNTENIYLKWKGSSITEYSDYYNRFVYTLSDPSSKPAYSHMMFVYQRSYKDPRMTKYAAPTEAEFSFIDTVYWDESFTVRAAVRYSIPYNGRPVSSANTFAGLEESSLQSSQANPLRMLSSTQFSLVNSSFLKADGAINAIWYADVCFMQAEAKLIGWGGSKTIEEYYNAGIDASFQQYELTQADALKYRSQKGVKWGVGRTDAFPDFISMSDANISSDPLHQIIAQRWVAGYFHGGHDAWCYIRRTRLLNLPVHMNPGNLITGGQGKIANMPERMQYPPDEILYNNDAYLDAVQKLGTSGDILPTYLKMATPYNRKTIDELLQLKIVFNNTAFKNWYAREGKEYTTIVDDLDPKGIPWLFIEVIN
ncbi:MAG: SusD/RagB family nutrient-binding outer membrane lipoprotein [Paludibacter sp.]|nr:SusD/RagB family nutrient-binding outer membrane lipoprotein [Paludibacter sp.]